MSCSPVALSKWPLTRRRPPAVREAKNSLSLSFSSSGGVVSSGLEHRDQRGDPPAGVFGVLPGAVGDEVLGALAGAFGGGVVEVSVVRGVLDVGGVVGNFEQQSDDRSGLLHVDVTVLEGGLDVGKAVEVGAS